jgi:hypothetical protein
MHCVAAVEVLMVVREACVEVLVRELAMPGTPKFETSVLETPMFETSVLWTSMPGESASAVTVLLSEHSARCGER